MSKLNERSIRKMVFGVLDRSVDDLGKALEHYWPVEDPIWRPPERYLTVYVGKTILADGGFVYPERWIRNVKKVRKQFADFVAYYPTPEGNVLLAAECKNLSDKRDFDGLVRDIEKLGKFKPHLNKDSKPHYRAEVHVLLSLTFNDDIRTSWEQQMQPQGNLRSRPAAKKMFQKLRAKGFKPLEPIPVGYRKPKEAKFVPKEKDLQNEWTLWALAALHCQ